MNGMRSPVRLLPAPAPTLVTTLIMAPFMALVLAACGSIADTTASRSTGLDCTLADLLGEKNAARLLAQEIDCKSKAAPQYPAKVYCYRTLGGVDCYRQPNPDGGRALRPDGVAATGTEAETVPIRPAAGDAVARPKPVIAAKPTKKPEAGGVRKPAAEGAAKEEAKAAQPPAGGGAKDSAAKQQPKKAAEAKARRLPARKPKRPPPADGSDDDAAAAGAKPG